jgi:hypothetical protein
MKEALGFRAKGRKMICADDTFELREMLIAYGKANNLDPGNREHVFMGSTTTILNQPIFT